MPVPFPSPDRTPQRRVRRARRAGTFALAGAVIGLSVAVYALAAPLLTSDHTVAARVASRPLTLHSQTASRTVVAGSTARYRLRIGGHGRIVRPRGRGRLRLPVRVWLSATAPLPRGVTARFTPRATRGTTAVLTLRTRTSTRPGRHRVRLRARGHLGPAGRRSLRRAYTFVTLVVTSPRRASFTIAGSTTGRLSPGRAAALDLSLTNSHRTALRLSRLDVRIAGVRAPAADSAHPCTTRDFSVIGLSGVRSVRLPGSRTRRLSALGVSAARLPHIVMADRPVNQDGCKGATLALRFAGTATRG